MVDVFFTVLRMSGYGVVAALVVMVLQLLLGRARASRTALLALWLIVAFRLVCPWSPPSPLSLFNWGVTENYAVRVSRVENTYVGDFKVGVNFPDGHNTEEFDRAVAAGAKAELNDSIHMNVAYYYENSAGNITPAKTFREVYGRTAAIVWLTGMGVFLAWGGVSYYLLRRRLRFAVKDEELPGVWYSDRIPSPCVTGLFRPQIYLTFGMSDEEKKYVLAHERQHIRNRDHVWKVLGWLILCVHWFNILLWGCWAAFLSNLEDACDQRTLRELGEDRKEDYGQALLSLSSEKRFRPGFSPLSFGEGDTKNRIKSVLKYKKPLAWLTALALVIGAAAGVCVLTGKTQAEEKPPVSAVAEKIEDLYGTWTVSGVIYLTPVSSSTTDYMLKTAAGREISFGKDRFDLNIGAVEGGGHYVLDDPVYEPMELGNAITVTEIGEGGLFGPLDITGKTARGWKVLDSAGNDTGWHIYSVNDRLWLGRWVVHENAAKPYGEYWTIWEAVRDENVRGEDRDLFAADTAVTWEYRPAVSPGYSFFPFDFVFTSDCDGLSFHCENGQLYLRNDFNPRSQGHDFGVEGRSYQTIFWSPVGDDGIVSQDTLTFTVCRGCLSGRRTDVGSGSIYIRLISGEDGVYTYSARAELSDDEHYYFVPVPDPELGGAQIGGGPDYLSPIRFTAVVTETDPDRGTVTVEPEQPIKEGIQRFRFEWQEPGEVHPGDRVLMTAALSKSQPEHGGSQPTVGTFGRVDEMILLSRPLAEWLADLTHDGVDERVYVTCASEYGEVFNLIVENTAGEVLWTGEAATVHVGQNGLYLYRDENGQYDLLNWTPYMSTGTAYYSFKLFSLSEQGEKRIILQDAVYFEMPDIWSGDLEKLRAFDQQINELLSRSEVLLSTNGDTPEGVWYGDPDHPLIPIGPWDSDTDYFEVRQAVAQGVYTFTAEIVGAWENIIIVESRSLWTDMTGENYTFVIPAKALMDDPALYQAGKMVSVTADGPLYRHNLPEEGTSVEAYLLGSTPRPDQNW